MASNIANTVNFGTTGLNVGDYTYSLYALSAPGYLPLNSYTNSYLVSSYTALGALVVPVITPVTYAATARTLPASQRWAGVAYGNGVFVAVGSSATGTATTGSASSTDGITWTARTMPSSNIWSAVAFGNGIFVAISKVSSIAATSSDGINWISRSGISNYNWRSITYGNGLFVASNNTTTSNVVATSPDGITWTDRTLPSTQTWGQVAYGNGRFLVTSTTSSWAVSFDGVIWQAVTVASGVDYLAFGNGKFVVLTNSTNVAYVSPDGFTWSSYTLPASAWGPITYGNNSFLAIVTGSTSAATSPDGITWTSRTMPTASNWYSLAFGAGRFVTVSGLAATTDAATIDYAVNATSFVLPNVQTLTGTTAYIKAT